MVDLRKFSKLDLVTIRNEACEIGFTAAHAPCVVAVWTMNVLGGLYVAKRNALFEDHVRLYVPLHPQLNFYRVFVKFCVRILCHELLRKCSFPENRRCEDRTLLTAVNAIARVAVRLYDILNVHNSLYSVTGCDICSLFVSLNTK
jgi:hypothetical protein